MRGESGFIRSLRLRAVALALPLIAALAGCTPWQEYKAKGYKVGPNYCRPNAAVADHWIDAADQRLSSDEPDLSHWWTAFNDPKLDELIHSAVNQNLSLREACFRILQARAALAIQMGNLYPQTQQAFGSYSRNAISALAANQQFLPNRFFDNWELGFNLAWELDFWGRFRRAIASAEAQLNASVFDYYDVLVTLLGDVASTYTEIRTLQQQLVYVRANVEIQKKSLTIATARFRGGLTSQLDEEQAISQLAQTEALIPQFEIRLRQANDRLCVLLGIPTVDLTPKLGEQSIPTAPADVVVGVPCDLLTRRPDVRRAEQLAAAQCEQIGIAVANLYPAIAVNGTVGFDAERFTDLFKDRSFQGAIGPSFQWNVLNYGRLVNNVRLQDARFCELVTVYRNTVLRANSEVEDGIIEFLQSQLRARSLQRSVDAAVKAVTIANAQYQGGEVDFNRVALLEQNLVQQQDLLAQAQGDIAIGLIRTYRALGGGWEADCDASGIPVGTSITGDGVMRNAEELPPGATVPESSPSRPNPPAAAPRQMPLPGPADRPAAKQRRFPTVAQMKVDSRRNWPRAAPDKTLRLRLARDEEPVDDPPESHAELLPQDRAQTRWRR